MSPWVFSRVVSQEKGGAMGMETKLKDNVLDEFERVCEGVGLKINVGKGKVLVVERIRGGVGRR